MIKEKIFFDYDLGVAQAPGHRHSLFAHASQKSSNRATVPNADSPNRLIAIPIDNIESAQMNKNMLGISENDNAKISTVD